MGFGFRAQGSRFRVLGFGFRVQGSECRDQGSSSGFRVEEQADLALRRGFTLDRHDRAGRRRPFHHGWMLRAKEHETDSAYTLQDAVHDLNKFRTEDDSSKD